MDPTSAVSGINQAATETSSTTSTASNMVDYDAFLQLLVAQLENQDPTEPVDNGQLMAQFASFSAVEQQIQTNGKLDELIRSNTLGDAAGLIGKTITSADGEVSGVVKAVLLAEDGVYAELEDGSKVAVTAGARISDPSQQTIETGSTNQFGLF